MTKPISRRSPETCKRALQHAGVLIAIRSGHVYGGSIRREAHRPGRLEFRNDYHNAKASQVERHTITRYLEEKVFRSGSRATRHGKVRVIFVETCLIRVSDV